MGRTNRNMADLNSKRSVIKLSRCDALIRKQGPSGRFFKVLLFAVYKRYP